MIASVVDSKVILEGLQRYGPTPIYLPVSYRILNAESAFFLQEANQDLMRNSSLQARTESFFVHQARQMPFVNATYGPLSVQQPVPLELLQTLPGPFNAPVLYFIINATIDVDIASLYIQLEGPHLYYQ
ncbi:Transmembrane protein 132C [Collichthys lucidus]|uniref:Transmembrane protein 132C n=1 Tax=Collichthys lucidus TaxID=240159 RepID=A0A4V6ARJ1_COLLU|nr:Transmembrane protein 132C [Collichthys lucidus]